MTRRRILVGGLCAKGAFLALFAFSTGFAQAERITESTSLTAAPMSMSEQREVAEKFVKERLDTWKLRLHLEDWNITVVLARKSELKPKTLGGTRWDKKKHTATVWVLDPADYNMPFEDILKDLEFTTVHELVHLELASLPRSEASRSNEEYAVNRLTEALLARDANASKDANAPKKE